MKTTQTNCSNCENKQACVPYFLHEGSMTHKDRDNRRMMILCLALCATLIIVVISLVAYYTSRTQMWNDTIAKLNQTILEVTHGAAPGP